jgi:hypothetical protein
VLRSVTAGAAPSLHLCARSDAAAIAMRAATANASGIALPHSLQLRTYYDRIPTAQEAAPPAGTPSKGPGAVARDPLEPERSVTQPAPPCEAPAASQARQAAAAAVLVALKQQQGAGAGAAAATATASHGESFLRVHWVAVPEAMRARRVNRSRRRRRARATPSGQRPRRGLAIECGAASDQPALRYQPASCTASGPLRGCRSERTGDLGDDPGATAAPDDEIKLGTEEGGGGGGDGEAAAAERGGGGAGGGAAAGGA